MFSSFFCKPFSAWYIQDARNISKRWTGHSSFAIMTVAYRTVKLNLVSASLEKDYSPIFLERMLNIHIHNIIFKRFYKCRLRKMTTSSNWHLINYAVTFCVCSSLKASIIWFNFHIRYYKKEWATEFWLNLDKNVLCISICEKIKKPMEALNTRYLSYP